MAGLFNQIDTKEFPTPWGSIHTHVYIYDGLLVRLQLCVPAAMPEQERERLWSEIHELAHREIAEHAVLGDEKVTACGCTQIIGALGLDTFKRIASPVEP